jgi:hypothetical protein
MTDIDISAKTDRELLIMAVKELNHISHRVSKHDKWLAGNGWPGIRFQVGVLWLLACGAYAIIMLFIGNAIKIGPIVGGRWRDAIIQEGVCMAYERGAVGKSIRQDI